MKWTYVSLAAVLQLGFSGLSLASFDNNGVGTLEDLLQLAKAEPVDVDISAQLERRQASGRCGSDGAGAKCPGNLCCSTFGYCGDGDSFCSQIAGCQAAFGWCEGQPLPSPSSSAAPTSSVTPTRSSTSTPTPSSTSTRPTSTSTSTTQLPTATSSASFPTVTVTSTVTSSITVSVTGGGSVPTVTTTLYQTVTSVLTTTVSVRTTLSPTLGGPTTTSNLPTSTRTTTPIITPTPTPTATTTSRSTTSVSTPAVSIPAGLRSSTDGTCGNGVTCLGSSGGQCCSQWGFCGDDRIYCVPLLGCQPQFGRCNSP